MISIKGLKVGKTIITSTYSDSISQSDSQELTVTAVSLGSISSIDNSVYCGYEIRPLPIITAVVNGKIVELQNERDYDLTYLNNLNVSTNQVKATVIATGKGNFTGTLEQTWNILPKVVTLQWGDTSWTYDGLPHSTTCVVTNLEPGDSCTVTLTGNSITNIGTQTVTATDLSNSNYTLTGASDISRTLTISAGLFIKQAGHWVAVKSVYQKVGGSWQQSQSFGDVFDVNSKYINKS